MNHSVIMHFWSIKGKDKISRAPELRGISDKGESKRETNGRGRRNKDMIWLKEERGAEERRGEHRELRAGRKRVGVYRPALRSKAVDVRGGQEQETLENRYSI